MPQTNTCVANGSLPPDIYTQNLATQLTYNINFEFEAEADVVVYREQPAGTFTLLTNTATPGALNYTINQGVSPALVTFTAAPGGDSLIIGRRTNICEPVAVFQVGAAIRAGDLNADMTQLLHLIQELRSTLGFMINGNPDDPIIPGQGMDLGDLDDVTLTNPTNMSWLTYNGTDWVNGSVIRSTDPWISDNTRAATTAAMDARFTDATADTVGLVWTQDAVDNQVWRALSFRTAPGTEPIAIANTDILAQGQGGANVLVINLAGGQFIVAINAPLLNWDVPSPGFVAQVENPQGADPFVSGIGTPFVETAGTVTTDRDEYTLQNPNPAYAPGAVTDQTVSTNANAVIQSNSANGDATGGTATATIPFVFSDGSANPPNAVLTQNWRDPGVNINSTLVAPRLFLNPLEDHQIAIATANLTTPGNATTTLDSDVAGDVFVPDQAQGNFNSTITFTPNLFWDDDGPTITASTVFARPAGVAAVGAYNTAAQNETEQLTLQWEFPNSWALGAATPTAQELVTAQNTLAGNNTDAFIINNIPVGQPNGIFWFVSRQAINGAQIILNGQPVDVFNPNIGVVNLQPNPQVAGYPPCQYNIISFNWPVAAPATVVIN
jgi:hypothetical protein